MFSIVDAEGSGDVCPRFFGLGQGDALASLCTAAGLQVQGWGGYGIPAEFVLATAAVPAQRTDGR